MQDTKIIQNGKNQQDWLPALLARRHRIDPRIAHVYLSDWSVDRWERKQ